jgi:AcrR family transcriptional regulator
VARRTKFDLKREATYEALLAAGMRAFAEHGFSATRVEDIVARTGQTKGAFYFHFKNKLDLLLQVNEYRQRQRESWQEVLDDIPAGAPLAEVVATVMAGFDARTDGIGAVWLPVMVGAFHQHGDDPGVRAAFAASYTRRLDELIEVLEALKARGLVQSATSSHTLAVQISALTDGYGAQASIYGLSDHRPVVDGIVQLLSP